MFVRPVVDRRDMNIKVVGRVPKAPFDPGHGFAQDIPEGAFFHVIDRVEPAGVFPRDNAAFERITGGERTKSQKLRVVRDDTRAVAVFLGDHIATNTTLITVIMRPGPFQLLHDILRDHR